MSDGWAKRGNLKDRIFLRREEGGYLVLEGSFIGEIPAAMAYAERSTEGLTVYARRAPRELVMDADKGKPMRIGVAKDEQEADKIMYECALKDGQHLSRATGKPFVDETGRAKESALKEKARG